MDEICASGDVAGRHSVNVSTKPLGKFTTQIILIAQRYVSFRRLIKLQKGRWSTYLSGQLLFTIPLIEFSLPSGARRVTADPPRDQPRAATATRPWYR